MKAATKKAKRARVNIYDPNVLVSLLEGPYHQAAGRFVALGRGLLRRADEDDFNGTINLLETPTKDWHGGDDGDPNYALTEVYKVLETLSLTDEADNRLRDAIHGATSHRTATAYLFGLAVGRRISTLPLMGGRS